MIVQTDKLWLTFLENILQVIFCCSCFGSRVTLWSMWPMEHDLKKKKKRSGSWSVFSYQLTIIQLLREKHLL